MQEVFEGSMAAIDRSRPVGDIEDALLLVDEVEGTFVCISRRGRIEASQRLQRFASVESIPSQIGERLGQPDARQGMAIGKSIVLYFRNAGRQLYLLQPDAVVEGVRGYRCQAGWYVDTLQMAAT